jgi:hypothetical protein
MCIFLALAGSIFAIVISTPSDGIIGSTYMNLDIGSGTPILMIIFMWIPIIVAMLWTVFRTFIPPRPKQSTHTQQETLLPQNAPTPYKMALLLEMMDDDEREAFKQQLKREILAEETSHGDFDRLALEETEKRKRG